MPPPVRFENVSKRFRKGESATALRDLIPSMLRRFRGGAGPAGQEFWALREVSFDVEEGEVLGIIGQNGAGKSTTLKLVAGILRANGGTVTVNGSISALIEVAAGFHPDLTGRENIFLNGSILGLPRRVIRERLDEIIDFAELREFIDTPVKRYSTGMYMRLGFSVAVHIDPEILLIDEVLAVGDLAFRRKCLDRIAGLKEQRKTIIFVSHKMNDVRAVCDRVIYLRQGRIHREGTALDVTREFEADMKKKSLIDVTGRPRSQRSGEGTVRITDVRVEDRRGRAATAIRSGDFLRVVVEFRTDEEIRDPSFSVSLLRSDNVRPCHLNSAASGIEVPAARGEGRFVVDFERLDLADDVYTVEAIVWNAEMNVPLAQHVNPSFEVSGATVPLNRPPVYAPPARFVSVESEATE